MTASFNVENMNELKCTNCGSPIHAGELDSIVKCDFCGAEYEIITDDNAKVELIKLKLIKEMYEDSKKEAVRKPKKPAVKKPAVKQKRKGMGCLIAIAVIVIAVIGIGIIGTVLDKVNSISSFKNITWSELSMGDVIPEPESTKCDVSLDSSYGLSLYVADYDKEAFGRYVQECQDMGFTIDSEKSNGSYYAYNQDGCYLDVWYYSSENQMHIRLDAPVDMSEFIWPSEGSVAQLVPPPESNYGKVEYDYSGRFCAYVGNTTKQDFLAYIETVKKAGFKKNYRNRENYFEANNRQDNYIRIEYKGFNTMYIRMDVNEDGIWTLD